MDHSLWLYSISAFSAVTAVHCLGPHTHWKAVLPCAVWVADSSVSSCFSFHPYGSRQWQSSPRVLPCSFQLTQCSRYADAIAPCLAAVALDDSDSLALAHKGDRVPLHQQLLHVCSGLDEDDVTITRLIESILREGNGRKRNRQDAVESTVLILRLDVASICDIWQAGLLHQFLFFKQWILIMLLG